MALFPFSVSFGIAGVIAAIVVLYGGINIQRSPVQALIADLVPSRYRSFATGSVTFQMCVGAVVFLMLGRILGMRTAFLVGSITVLAIAATFRVALREPVASPRAVDAETAETVETVETTFRSLGGAVWTALSGELPGMRAVFAATFLVQLTFQTFTTWFSLHGTERFGVRPEDVTIGFIAWAMGGVFGALPAGVVGVRIGRRNAMLLGLAVMTVALVALHFVTSFTVVAALLALVSAAWTFPTVNAYPLFVEPVPPARRGVLAALFLLSMALGGAIGDPLNGSLFDLFGSYRPMFLDDGRLLRSGLPRRAANPNSELVPEPRPPSQAKRYGGQAEPRIRARAPSPDSIHRLGSANAMMLSSVSGASKYPPPVDVTTTYCRPSLPR